MVYDKSGNLNYLKQFKIPFKGLSLGVHHYDWALEKKFFDAFENPDVLDCTLDVKLELEKQERMMILNFSISGDLEVACDRCLENFNLPVAIQEKYFIKFGDEHREESESVQVIPESEYQIDIAQLIFDFVSLSVPIKKVHPDDKHGKSLCNKDTMQKVEEHQVDESIDPRWEALKNIKLEKNN